MGLFGKKSTPDTASETKGVAVKTVAPQVPRDITRVIVKNVYTFEVTKGANKYEVRDAIKALYNVTPKAVRIVNKTPRHFMSRMRGRDMMEHGLRKAYVYLKEGDRIDLV